MSLLMPASVWGGTLTLSAAEHLDIFLHSSHSFHSTAGCNMQVLDKEVFSICFIQREHVISVSLITCSNNSALFIWNLYCWDFAPFFYWSLAHRVNCCRCPEWNLLAWKASKLSCISVGSSSMEAISSALASVFQLSETPICLFFFPFHLLFQSSSSRIQNNYPHNRSCLSHSWFTA